MSQPPPDMPEIDAIPALPAGTSAWLRMPPADGVGDTWLYFHSPASIRVAGDLATRARLSAQGFAPIDLEAETFLPFILESQLMPLRRMQHEGRPFAVARWQDAPPVSPPDTPWALPSDLEQARAVPVILALDLPDQLRAALQDDARLLVMAEDLPPPQLGTLAMIPDHERHTVTRYHVSTLGGDGVALCRELGETLIELAAPARWWIYTPHLQAALDIATYERTRQEWHSRILATRGKERTAAKATLAALEQAREHAEKLRIAHQRRERHAEEWQRQYAHARDLAHQLATLYLDAHVAQLTPAVALAGTLADTGVLSGALTVGDAIAPTSADETPTPAETPATIAASDSAPALDAETGAEAARVIQPPLLSDQAGETPAQGDSTMEQALAPTSAKPAPRRRGRPRGARRLALVTQDPPAAMMPAHALVRELMTDALLRRDLYREYEDAGIAEYQGDMGRTFGPLTITLKAEQDEKWEAFLKQLNLLGDELVDTFCALLMLAISENGVSDRDPGRVTQRFTCYQDDILQVAGRKKSHGSYTAESRAKVMGHMHLLERMRVQAKWPTGWGTYVTINSPFLVVRRIGEYKSQTDEPIWESQDIELGEWAAQLVPAMSQQLVPMLRTVLAYHSERDKYPKRIGRYLTPQFRVNADRGGRFTRSMRALLEQSGIIPDRNNPGAARDTIERALATLKADGVIGDYRQVVDATPTAQEARERVEQRAYGWWRDYEQLRWEFDPPEYHADMIAAVQSSADDRRQRATARKALQAPKERKKPTPH